MPHKNDVESLITQAAFLCNKQSEMLILKLPDQRWQLPGGKLQYNENWLDGVLREIQEETGIVDIIVHAPLYVDNWHTVTHHYYRTYFLCTTRQKNIHLSNDHIDYKWIKTKKEIEHLVFTHETVKNHIKMFLDTIQD